MAEGQGSGLSRRRVLQGTAWSVPVVLIATAVPARATSLEGNYGIFISDLTAYYSEYFWDATGGENVHAIMCAGGLINNPAGTGPSGPIDPGNISSMQYTVSAPVGDVEDPRWGLGSNEQLITIPGFTLVSGPIVEDGVATLVFLYTGGLAMNQYLYAPVWVQSELNRANQQAAALASAQHTGGNTSEDSRTDVTKDIADLEHDVWNEVFGDRYIPPEDDPDEDDEDDEDDETPEP